MEELQEATKEFLIESHENLDQLDTDLLGLERAAAPAEALGRIFRTLHTIKGSCSFLGFTRLEAVAHAGENLLGKLRDGKVELDASITNALLSMVDAIRGMLAHVEHEGNDGGDANAQLIALLNGLAGKEPVDRTFVAAGGSLDLDLARGRSDFSLREGVERQIEPAQASVAQEAAAAVDAGVASDAEATFITDASAVYDASVRISVELLDKLMTIAGEIVLARNQILQYGQRQGDPAFQNTCRQLNLITSELQEHVMKTRLQPIGNVWSRLPRVARDAAQARGKKVRLEMEGSETELDKTLLEAIRDPLTHVVRNAVDHGIESPEWRKGIGKPEEGCIRLSAYHEGGQVNVEISDDGSGIDPERVKSRALEQRLVTPEQAARMGTSTLLGLIFLPGFSTASTVTTTSGRGVGMDVLKTNVEKIGGSVDVHSTMGRGTTVRIRIPLTLAIIKVLIVTCAGDRYAIPQVSIVELVRVDAEKAPRCIQRVHGALVYRYRNRLLPLVRLNEALKVEDEAGAAAEAVSIVVLQAANRQFGLVVDGINDTQEIVVKPLWKHLKSLACFAGATVMGDGKVALILDVFGLAQRSGAISDLAEGSAAEAKPVVGKAGDGQRVLLVHGQDQSLMAIALENVARIEEFAHSRVERVANRQLVQYRGQLMQLVDVDAALASKSPRQDSATAASASNRDALQVVVTTRAEQPVGLVVNRILDVVDHEGGTMGPALRPGVAGTTVVQGRVAELLDVEELVSMASRA